MLQTQRGHELRSKRKTHFQTPGSMRKTVSNSGSHTCLLTSPRATEDHLWSLYWPPNVDIKEIDCQLFSSNDRFIWNHQWISIWGLRTQSTHGYHQMVNTKIRLIIFFVAKDGEALYSQQKQDQEPTVAQIVNSFLPNSDLNWRK